MHAPALQRAERIIPPCPFPCHSERSEESRSAPSPVILSGAKNLALPALQPDTCPSPPTLIGPSGTSQTPKRRGLRLPVIYSPIMTARISPQGPGTLQRFGVLVLAPLMLVLIFPGRAWSDKNEKARKKLNEALKHYEQGGVFYHQGKLEAAIAEYRAALRGDPDEPYWHQALGDALEKQGDSQSALEEYHQASRLSPDDVGLQHKYNELQKVPGGDAGEPADAAVPEHRSYAVGGKVTAPLPQFKPEPSYTEKARVAKYSGTVVLMLVVDAHGDVGNVSAVRPLSFGLSEQAIRTVRTWHFQPSTRDGMPVPVRVVVEVSFRLF